jgi:hypothetical protein
VARDVFSRVEPEAVEEALGVVVARHRDRIVLLDQAPLLELVKDLEPLDSPQLLAVDVQPGGG